MKKAAYVFMAGACLWVGPVFAEEQPASYPGPQEAAPNVYKQVFDNEKVRVSEIRFNPGDRAVMHTHPYDHFVYVIEPGQLTLSYPDGRTQVVDGTAGQVMWLPTETHEAVNSGSTPFRALVGEVKTS